MIYTVLFRTHILFIYIMMIILRSWTVRQDYRLFGVSYVREVFVSCSSSCKAIFSPKKKEKLKNRRKTVQWARCMCISPYFARSHCKFTRNWEPNQYIYVFTVFLFYFFPWRARTHTHFVSLACSTQIYVQLPFCAFSIPKATAVFLTLRSRRWFSLLIFALRAKELHDITY